MMVLDPLQSLWKTPSPCPAQNKTENIIMTIYKTIVHPHFEHYLQDAVIPHQENIKK